VNQPSNYAAAGGQYEATTGQGVGMSMRDL